MTTSRPSLLFEKVFRTEFTPFSRRLVTSSAENTNQLIRKQRNDSEHGAQMNLLVRAVTDIPQTEAVLQTTVPPLGRGAFLVSFGSVRIHGRNVFPVTLVRVYDRNVSHLLANAPYGLSVIGGVHQFVQAGHLSPGHSRQRNGHLAVMNRSGGRHGAAIRLVNVKLVSYPPVHVSLGVELGSHVADARQLRQGFLRRPIHLSNQT